MAVTDRTSPNGPSGSTRDAGDDVMPQVEIERAVLERARLTDVDAGQGIGMLHQLVADEVERWNADHSAEADPSLSRIRHGSPSAPCATSPATGRSSRSSTTTTSGRSWSTLPTRSS